MRHRRKQRGVHIVVGEDGTEYLVTRDDEATDKSYLWRGFAYGDAPEIFRQTLQEVVTEIKLRHG